MQQARSSSQPDPYVVLTVGTQSEQTSTVMRSSDPVYEKSFTFLVPNPESDTLYVKIRDQKTDNDLGHLVYQLSSLSGKQDLQVDKQPFALLKAGPDSKIYLSMHLRVSNNQSHY